jgi:hypothetical protein
LVGQDQDDNDKNKKKKGGVIVDPDATGGGVLGGIGTHAAEVFGLVVLGGAITVALIETHRNGRGINPSPGTNR